MAAPMDHKRFNDFEWNAYMDAILDYKDAQRDINDDDDDEKMEFRTMPGFLETFGLPDPNYNIKLTEGK